ncbi:hypothetical protein BH11PLA2_BH11PLA2_16100 [soil metagenome]
MGVTTIRTVAADLGISYWAVRHAIRRGYVGVERDGHRRKIYLTPTEVKAIKTHFGVCDPDVNTDMSRKTTTRRP